MLSRNQQIEILRRAPERLKEAAERAIKSEAMQEIFRKYDHVVRTEKPVSKSS